MWKCQNCKVEVPDTGMIIFIKYGLVTIMGTKKDGDIITGTGVTKQIRLCEKCRKLNNLELDLDQLDKLRKEEE